MAAAFVGPALEGLAAGGAAEAGTAATAAEGAGAAEGALGKGLNPSQFLGGGDIDMTKKATDLAGQATKVLGKVADDVSAMGMTGNTANL